MYESLTDKARFMYRLYSAQHCWMHWYKVTLASNTAGYTTLTLSVLATLLIFSVMQDAGAITRPRVHELEAEAKTNTWRRCHYTGGREGRCRCI